MSNMIISNFEYDINEQLEAIISNVFKMLQYRKLINKFTNETIKSAIHQIKKKMEYDIKLNVKDRKNDDLYKLIILNEDLERLTSGTDTLSYMSKYPNIHKIIIVNSINKNIELQIMSKPKTEIFIRSYFMINIAEYKYVPQHILLTDDEKKKVVDEYNIPLNNYPKIMLSDPMSKYCNANIHDIIKIIRPSAVSGFVFYYRYVIKG